MTPVVRERISFLIEGRSFAAETSLTALTQFEVRSLPRPYKVLWTDEDAAFYRVRALLDENPGNMLFVDKKVLALHGGAIYLPDRLLPAQALEEFKTLASVTGLIDFLMQGNFTRGENLAVVGGGITQDVGAFACAMYKRGVRWMLFPTTLLSMCDSCIGGKTGVNYGGAKNQLALFFTPTQVVINPNFLKTLDKRDLLSGMGEILKTFVLGGPHFIELYKKNVKNGLPEDFSCYKKLILPSLSVKRAVVEEDEFELDHRRALNYGHTVGHAVETLSGYEIPHGQAVSIGLIIANELSVNRRLLSRSECDDLNKLAFELLDKTSLRTMRALSTENILSLMQKDKKAAADSVTLVLVKTAGSTVFMKTRLDSDLKAELTAIVRSRFHY